MSKNLQLGLSICNFNDHGRYWDIFTNLRALIEKLSSLRTKVSKSRNYIRAVN